MAQEEDQDEYQHEEGHQCNLDKNNRILLRQSDVAHLLQVSERTVWTLRKEHGLKAVKIGRSVRFKIRDVVDFSETLDYQ